MTAHDQRSGAIDSESDARIQTPRLSTPLLVIAVAVAFVVLFQPIIAVRSHFYMESARYSHCLLLPLVSALWIYDRWDELRPLPRVASRAGLAILGVAVALFLYGRALGVNLPQHVAALLAITGIVWSTLGARWSRALAFPIGYLLLTIPLPTTIDDRITLPLQRIATIMSEGAFDAFGWVVVRQGNVIQLPGLKLLVEEQCSGAHSLYALGALAVAWVFFVQRPVWLRFALVAAVLPIAILANSLRVIGTGVLAYKVDPAYADGVSHQTAGMIVFAIGVSLLLLVDWCLKPDLPVARQPEPAEAQDGADG